MLSDARLTAPIARIINAATLAETYNDPMTRTGTPVTRSKPGSRPPGETQCDYTVARIGEAMEKCARECERLLNNARIRQPRAVIVTRVGGVVVREERIKSHLLGKYGG